METDFVWSWEAHLEATLQGRLTDVTTVREGMGQLPEATFCGSG